MQQRPTPRMQVLKNPNQPPAPPVEGRTVAIPRKHIAKFWKLYDLEGNLAKYRFWAFVEPILPETAGGNWALKAGSIMSPHLVEHLPPEQPK